MGEVVQRIQKQRQKQPMSPEEDRAISDAQKLFEEQCSKLVLERQDAEQQITDLQLALNTERVQSSELDSKLSYRSLELIATRTRIA